MNFKTKEDRDNFILSNIGIPHKVIQHLHIKSGLYEHTYEDLAQIGYEALIIAVDRYMPELGTPFSSYAWIFIRNHLVDEMRNTIKHNKNEITFIEPDDIYKIPEEQNDIFDYGIPNSVLYNEINNLPESEKYILLQHVLHKKTFKELSKDLGVTFQRIQQIYKKTCSKLLEKFNKYRYN